MVFCLLPSRFNLVLKFKPAKNFYKLHSLNFIHNFIYSTGIHYVGKMIEGDQTKVLLDQITEGQVTWVPMDKEYDIVR